MVSRYPAPLPDQKTGPTPPHRAHGGRHVDGGIALLFLVRRASGSTRAGAIFGSPHFLFGVLRLLAHRPCHLPRPRPAPAPPAETTIIFDWDDTLLSSSWLAQNQLRLDMPIEVPHEAAAQLDLLQESVIALIDRASKFGDVVIITNAETGWVEMSCRKFMPRVFPLLAGMRILSARSSFEARFPESPSDWKVRSA